MKQLKELKLNDTVLTADEVEQKINAAVSGVTPDGNLLCATTVCAGTVCSGIVRANNMFVNNNGGLTIGLGPQGQVTGPHLRVTKTQIETSGLNSRGNFAFTLAADKEIQVARIKEVREEIDAKLAEFTPSGGSGVSIDEFNGLKSQVAAKADKAHTHKAEDVGGLVATLGGKADAEHTHVIDDVGGLRCALDEKANAVHKHVVDDVYGLSAALGAKANAEHTHEIDDVEGLRGALGAKADAAHTHKMGDVQGLSNVLESLRTEISTSGESKADKVHTHEISDVNGLADSLAGKQDKLTPGANISIENGVISATGGSGGTADLTNYYTKTEVDKCITDVRDEVLGEVAADYYCKTEIDNMVLENLPEHTHEISEVTGLEDCLTSKQGKLKEGTNITIAEDGTISAAGGSGGSVIVDAALDAASTNPIQNQWLGKRLGATSSNSVQIGYGAKASSAPNVAIEQQGYYDYGGQVAIGSGANGTNCGVAVGNSSVGACGGVAVGFNAIGNDYGVAVGGSTAGAGHTVAIGFNAKASDATPIVIGTDNYASAKITVSKDGLLKIGGKEVGGAQSSLFTEGGLIQINPKASAAVSSVCTCDLLSDNNLIIFSGGTYDFGDSCDAATGTLATHNVLLGGDIAMNLTYNGACGDPVCRGTIVGYGGQLTGYGPTAVGADAIACGNSATAIGTEAFACGHDTTAIGHGAQADEGSPVVIRGGTHSLSVDSDGNLFVDGNNMSLKVATLEESLGDITSILETI